MKPLIILFLKGMFIGLANLIPGLTLATAAFLIGSYVVTLQALKSFNFTAARYFYRHRWKELASHIPWQILLVMPMGALVTYYTLPQFLPITYWQSLYKPQIYAALCGLTLGGTSFALSQHRGAGLAGFLLFFCGLAASTLPLLIAIPALPVGWEYQFLTGMTGTVLELIPGVPESVIGKLIHHYDAVSYYADRGFWPASVLFIAGIITGILSVVMLFAFSFRRFQEQTFSLLFGLASGVILQLWPLRFMQSSSEKELVLVTACFIGGIAASGLLQFFQRRTLG